MSVTGTATIIGGDGFVGRGLAGYLRSTGWQCRIPARSESWPQRGHQLGHIFYCAGLTADYLVRPADTVEAHVSLLAQVLQSDAFESLVYLSSTRLYDSVTVESSASEGSSLCISPLNPRHFYDLTKLTGESICHTMGGGRARVARLACVYDGPDDVAGFLPGILKRLVGVRRGDQISVASSPHFSRDYVHRSDVVVSLVDIAVRGTQPVYNVASGENVSNSDLAALIEARGGRKIFFELDNEPKQPAVVDIQRLRNEFGLCPKTVDQQIGPWLDALP